MRVLIIEDEIMARRSLEKLLENNFPDIEVVAELGSVSDSVAWLKAHPEAVDTIFMDVELSDGECFEIFRQVEVKVNVVMTTAYAFLNVPSSLSLPSLAGTFNTFEFPLG